MCGLSLADMPRPVPLHRSELWPKHKRSDGAPSLHKFFKLRILGKSDEDARPDALTDCLALCFHIRKLAKLAKLPIRLAERPWTSLAF